MGGNLAAGTEISIPDWYDRKNYGATDSMFADGNGGMTKMDGWGSDAMGFVGGLGNMYMQNKAINAQEEDAKKRFDFMKGDSEKNWAMRMNEYRQFQNRISHEAANRNSVRNGTGILTGDAAAQFEQGNNMLDWKGNARVDPFSVGANGKITTPQPASITNSAFSPAATTTTPQTVNQVAGGSDTRPKQPGDRARDAEKKRVEKLTV